MTTSISLSALGSWKYKRSLDRLKKQTDLPEGSQKGACHCCNGWGKWSAEIVVDHRWFSLSDIQKRSKIIQRTSRNYCKGQKGQSHLPILCSRDHHNPLYLNLPELTNIQTAVDRWNGDDGRNHCADGQVYSVPINDLLYKELICKMGVSEVSDTEEQPLSMMHCMKRIVPLTIRAMKKINKQYWKINATKTWVKNNPIKEGPLPSKNKYLEMVIFRFGQPSLSLRYSCAGP